MPDGLSHLAQALPSGALGEALRAALEHGSLALGPVLTLALWTAVATALTIRTFRWD
jgi:ABC-2 type transport system permease protein